MRSFIYTESPRRAVFGPGALSLVKEELDLLGAKRAFLVTTSRQKLTLNAMSADLGGRLAGVFAKAAPHAG